jgi:hypothetical protein
MRKYAPVLPVIMTLGVVAFIIGFVSVRLRPQHRSIDDIVILESGDLETLKHDGSLPVFESKAHKSVVGFIRDECAAGMVMTWVPEHSDIFVDGEGTRQIGDAGSYCIPAKAKILPSMRLKGHVRVPRLTVPATEEK